MWDNWLFQEDQYYLFFLMGLEEGPWNAFGLATSIDAIHWKYHGPIVKQKHADATWMGTGYTWRSPVPGVSKYYLNFSEWFDSPDHPGQQKIYFCESDDLLHWTHLPDELASTPDPRYYRLNEGGMSRWDTIHELKKPGGGLYGYLTANPKDILHGPGLVESEDGIHWRCLPAPEMIWSKREHAALMHRERGLEIGGIARFGNRYAMIISDSHFGMGIMWADKPEGPFTSQVKNFNFMPAPKGPDKHSPVYYARFFFSRSGDTFFNIHAIAKPRAHGKEPHPVYTTPLKLARVDAEGILRAWWWQGNDLLKHVPLEMRLGPEVVHTGWILQPISPGYDVRKGVVVEAQFTIPRPGQKVGLAIKLTNPFDIASLYEVFLIGSDGSVEIGVIDLDEGEVPYDFEDHVDLEFPLVPDNKIHLLQRLGFVELYLNDQLLVQWSLAMWPSGEMAWMATASQAPVSLVAWHMDLRDIDRTAY